MKKGMKHLAMPYSLKNKRDGMPGLKREIKRGSAAGGKGVRVGRCPDEEGKETRRPYCRSSLFRVSRCPDEEGNETGGRSSECTFRVSRCPDEEGNETPPLALIIIAF